MWQRFTHPDLLIYLDVSWETARQRRPTLDAAEPAWWREQAGRLRHARQHADLYVFTDPLSPQAVLQRVWEFLATRQG
jgi:hypothetical protein